MKIRTIIFDLDGTLLNTLDDLMDSVNAMLLAKGYPVRSYAEIRAFVGNGVEKLVERALPAEIKLSQEERAACLAEFRAHYQKNMRNKTAPYAGIDSMLNEVAQRGYRMAIVSNKFDSGVKELRDDFFPQIPVAIGLGKGLQAKPAPNGVWLAMETLGARQEETVYVGDSDVDALTAKNSGLPFIGVLWGFRDREVLEAGGAAAILERPEELAAVLEQLAD